MRITHFAIFFIAASNLTFADELSREQLNFFETKIRPVLIRECYGCHSAKAGNVRGGLRLDTKELTLIGGSSGPAIVPGNVEDSWLYNAITHQDFVMPPKRMLPQKTIDDFREWIEMGAPDPRVSAQSEIKSKISQDDIDNARDSFWAYQKPLRPAVPDVENTAWVKTEIDRFIAEKLEAEGLQPAADAAPWQVLRRLSFDLIGLPPTPDHIEAFHTAWKVDPDAAIEEAIDELLQKPQFGERWGRHWLDVARYAESTGSQVNMTYPHAWRYRDYVIDAFNADKPFDQFVKEQIAGDLLPASTDEQWARNLVATTFLAIGPKNVNEQNRVQFEADVADEQIDATTRAFLGTSVACARCHDHKFDAIPQTDYYALAGIFGNMKTYFGNPPSEYGAFSGVQARRQSSLLRLPIDDPNPYDKTYSSGEYADLKEEMENKIQEVRSSRTRRSSRTDAANAQRQRIRLANELASLSSKLAVVDSSGQPLSYCMGVQETERPVDRKLLVRGEIGLPAQTVRRGFPQVLCSQPVSIDQSSSGRLEFAKWVASEQNPLTARVFVNRVWKHLIGNGIVTSMENFGSTGQYPSHPELLDYLAVRFVESGWSVKSLIRDIARSRVYRISSDYNKEYHEADPDNALVWRANPRRLDAEALRDAMLSASGEIDFARPRGSEVAKAGYRRVQGGILGDPRDMARTVMRNSMQSRPGGRFNPGGAGRRPGRFPSRGNRRTGSQADMQAAIDEARHKVTHQLDMEDAKFRSVYLPIVRDEEPRSLEVFDFADASTITGTRETSNTANQALYMLNNRFVIQQSEALADRITEFSSRPVERIEYAFRLVYGRPPTAGELKAVLKFVQEYTSGSSFGQKRTSVMTAVCQSLFASAEFRILD